MRFALASSAALALLLAACHKPASLESKAAIQAAIEKHLQQRPNLMLPNMTLNVEDVKLDGDRAEAEVRFQSKQAPQLSVGVHYVLRKVVDHWEVVSSSVTSGMGGNPHGGSAGPMPTPETSTPAPQPSH